MNDDQFPIPIFIMSHNDLVSLRLCLRALTRRTRRSYRLVIVDNGSSDPALRRFLDRLSRLTCIQVQRNRFNLWVLGLNKVIRAWSRDSPAEALFVLTDCDILVPPPQSDQCWLTRLEASMQRYACVGKLGLSLDLGYIRTRPQFRHTYERERFFTEGPRIGDLVIAPVDTTLAIYRKSMFVTRYPLFVPTHQGLYRANMYCCRTNTNFHAKHLSWRFYESRPVDDVVSKLICFGLLGVKVNAAAVVQAPIYARWFYLLVRPMTRVFWGSIAASLQGVYMLRSFPMRLNRLQASRRS